MDNNETYQIDESWDKGSSSSYRSDHVKAAEYEKKAKSTLDAAKSIGKSVGTDHPKYRKLMGDYHSAMAKHVKHAYHGNYRGGYPSQAYAKKDYNAHIRQAKEYRSEVKEEAEHIDEVSTDTLKKYIVKAKSDPKRQRGVNTAINKELGAGKTKVWADGRINPAQTPQGKEIRKRLGLGEEHLEDSNIQEREKMSNIDKYTNFISEQARKENVIGLRSINEEVTNSMVHQHAGAMHAAKTLRDEGYGDDEAKAHAKKIEAKVAAKHGKEGVAALREKSKAAVKELRGHIRAADNGSAEAQRKVDNHPVMKHADKHLEDLY